MLFYFNYYFKYYFFCFIDFMDELPINNKTISIVCIIQLLLRRIHKCLNIHIGITDYFKVKNIFIIIIYLCIRGCPDSN